MKGIALLLLVAVAATHAQVEECPAEQEINWEIEMLLRHEDCNKFYKCTFGKPVEYSCYYGLYFNLETWQCDWPHNVDCDGRHEPEPTTLAPVTEPTTTTTTLAPTTITTTTAPTTTTTTTTPAPTTTITTTTPTPTTTTTTTTPAPTTTTTTTTPAPTTTTTTTTPAPTTTTTTTTPAPTTTTTTTTTPAPTTTTTTTAPAPTTTTTTTTPAPTTTTTTTTPAPTTTSSTTTHVPECEIETNPAPSPTPEPEEEDQELEFRPNGCPVDPHIHWLLPNAEDCNLFFYCVWGELVLRECSPTLHFNPTLQVCDWPQSAGCTLSANKHAVARRRLLKQILN